MRLSATSARLGGTVSSQIEGVTHGIADTGGTPLVVVRGQQGSRCDPSQRTSSKAASANALQRFRAMGIRTVMITGDNPRTAAAIAREAGVDDFLARSDAGSENAADQRRAERKASWSR